MTAGAAIAVREPGSIRLAGTLGIAGLLSGLLLVLAYETTLPIIERNRAEALRSAVFEVVPGAVDIRAMVASGGSVVAVEGDRAVGGDVIYAALGGDGQVVGYAIPAAGSGFQDVISLIFGFVPGRGRVVGMRVLESRETPGLGDKIYKDAQFVADFEDLAIEPSIEVVPNGQGRAANHVDAITGATISSKAVVRIVQDAVDVWVPRLGRAREEER